MLSCTSSKKLTKGKNQWVPQNLDNRKDVWTVPLEFVFQEQSYSSLHSGRSLAWDHFRSNSANPWGVIANFCGVTADHCGVVAIPKAISGHTVGAADRCVTQ